MQNELSHNAVFPIYWSNHTYSHELWVVTEKTRLESASFERGVWNTPQVPAATRAIFQIFAEGNGWMDFWDNARALQNFGEILAVMLQSMQMTKKACLVHCPHIPDGA